MLKREDFYRRYVATYEPKFNNIHPLLLIILVIAALLVLRYY